MRNQDENAPQPMIVPFGEPEISGGQNPKLITQSVRGGNVIRIFHKIEGCVPMGVKNRLNPTHFKKNPTYVEVPVILREGQNLNWH